MCGIICYASFVSCNTDDGESDTSADLVGTWAVTSLEYDGTTSFDFLGETINTSFDGVGQNLDLTFTFSENPNEYSAEGYYDIILDFTVNGMSETETTSVDNLQQEGTWERNGNILFIDGEIIDLDVYIPARDTTGMSDLTILELTDTTLRLGQKVSEQVTEEGITVSVSISSEFVFTRQ